MPVVVSAALLLTDLNSTAVTQIHAHVDKDALGRSVAIVGDINGDGFADVLVGAPADFDGGSNLEPGGFVIFGNSIGLPANLDIRSLNGSNGFALSVEQSGTLLGRGVTATGDFNDDGIDDFAISAPLANVGTGSNTIYYAGKVYVVFGHAQGVAFSGTLNLDALTGSDGFVINGGIADERVGYSLANAGDFNGDGVNDLLIGALSINGIEDAHIVLGSSSAFPASFSLANIAVNNQGFRLTATANTQFARSVAGIGDIDGDGKADVAIGAPMTSNSNGNGNSGSVYIVHGRALAVSSGGNVLALELPSSLGVERLDGDGAGDYAGAAVAGVGDINADGIPDFAIGAPGTNAYQGAAYVVFGSATLASGALPGLLPSKAFRIVGSVGDYNTNIGAALVGGKDFDGDGITDLVLGVPGGRLRSGETRNGSVYILPGRTADNPWPDSVVLDTLDYGQRLDGVTDIGPSSIGNMIESMSLAVGADVNGDGKSELLIGTPLANASTSNKTNGPWQGSTWVVFGQALEDVIFRDGFEAPPPL